MNLLKIIKDKIKDLEKVLKSFNTNKNIFEKIKISIDEKKENIIKLIIYIKNQKIVKIIYLNDMSYKYWPR